MKKSLLHVIEKNIEKDIGSNVSDKSKQMNYILTENALQVMDAVSKGTVGQKKAEFVSNAIIAYGKLMLGDAMPDLNDDSTVPSDVAERLSEIIPRTIRMSFGPKRITRHVRLLESCDIFDCDDLEDQWQEHETKLCSSKTSLLVSKEEWLAFIELYSDKLKEAEISSAP